MKINHNIMALNTYSQYTANNKAIGGSIEKLSSGLRINSASDDAAGLAISEKMRGQIRGLDQASKNAADGISMAETAEGALNETHSILQRMRELAVQSANDTNTDDDRAEIQKEITQLSDEIDRISDTTQFNTKNLLDGSMGAGTTARANINQNEALGVIASSTSTLASLTDKDGNSLGITAGDTITVQYMVNGQLTSGSYTVASSTSDLTNITSLITDGTMAFTATSGAVLSTTTAGFSSAIHGLTITVTDSNGTTRASATNALSSFTEAQTAQENRADGQATLQIGANTSQNMKLSIENMSSTALGVKSIQVGNQGQANVAISVIDEAIGKVSAERSKIGAVTNRLDHTINNLTASSESLTTAESGIRDVDMAAEMMNLTKNQILSQASTAMLAQANQVPQGVTQLLQ
ncbi:flagellin [Eubacteriaceae bacterium ES3]|nr:flagellin [Eubacteriaceae bacterium ES3]